MIAPPNVACSTQLIIKAAITGRNVLGHGPLTEGCNNMGVAQHGNIPRCPMLEKQPQSDVLQYFKGYVFVQNWRIDGTGVWSRRQVPLGG